MENTVAAEKKLAGWDTHGFFSMEDLDVDCIMKEARERWLRPNEIHAILCNYSYFSINVRPVNLPQSGRIILFDRKKLRNFRKDGHNWKKKKDGKTIKEAHEHLKVGTEEKIHVYYAHGEDNPTFVRRCYWLLDKTLEHIVLVHYRETHEGTLSTSADSMSSPGLSDPSVMISDETDSVADRLLYSNEKVQIESGSSMTLVNHEMRLHEINTLEWEELVVPDNPDHFIGTETEISFFEHHDQFGRNTLLNNVSRSDAMLPFNNLPPESSPNMLSEPVFLNNSLPYEKINNFDSQRIDGEKNTDLQRKHSPKVTVQNHLHTQESFGSLMNYGMADSPDPLNGSELIDSVDTHSLQSSTLGQLLTITDISPAWGFAAEETKVLLTGLFNEGNLGLGKSNLYCVCGDACNPVENFQHGVFRCIVSSHNPGLKRLYFSLDGQNPISEVINFEFRAKSSNGRTLPDTDEREEFRLQARLIHLLFSTSKSLDTLSSKASPTALKEGKIFVHKTSQIADEWKSLVHSIRNDEKIFSRAKDDLFTLTLKNRLYEWLLERVVRGGKTLEYDDQGQGVIHMCAMLDYTWAVYPFKLSGMSLDYRDKSGWTALHWAAYCGRENMVAALLSAGAKPNLVTDPNSEDPSGCIAADLASKKGHEGLSGYLAEKALVAHFEDMKIAGNIIGSLETENRFELTNAENLSEEELHLKDTLAAYRTAADAAGRIQTAFREQSFKLRRKAVEECASTEEEARGIVAAMKIQHAYRKYEARKQITAASRIQCRFRTWKIRKDFLNMRRQAIRIQATFRGFQARKSYRKIIWSVGVLEKAIIRWRLRKKGFRGLQLPMEENQKKEGGDVEDFFQVGRKQAEDRTVKAVVRVQAMFRSKQAQQEYRRMKLAHNAARLEYEGLDSPDIGMR